MNPAQRTEIERLRGFKASAPGNLALTAEFDRLDADARRQRKSVGSVAVAWSELVPPQLAGKTGLTLDRGTLWVQVDDASTRFQLDAWLRQGGRQALLRRCSAPIRAIRLTLGPPTTPPPSKR